MRNMGSMVKRLSRETVLDYAKNVLHMDKVTVIPSPDSDHWYLKGLNEAGDTWMEIRVEAKPDKNSLHNVGERRWAVRHEAEFEWIDALPKWNGEPSDDIEQYLP